MDVVISGAGGLIGSALMLLECSGKGADIYIDKIPAPLEVPLKDWLLTFPSFGFILSLRPHNTAKVEEKFKELGLAFERIGKVTSGLQVFFLGDAGDRNLFWDFGREPLIGFADSPTTKARRHKGSGETRVPAQRNRRRADSVGRRGTADERELALMNFHHCSGITSHAPNISVH